MNIETRGRAAAEGLESATTVDVEAGLSRLRRSRRRRDTGRVVVACVVTATIIGGFMGLDRDESVAPAPQPAPTETETSSAGGEWTPEQIRAESTQATPVLTTESGFTVRQYELDIEEERHIALEVAKNGQSALFDVLGEEAWVSDFDETSLLVQDDATWPPTWPQIDWGRARLLRADGTSVELRRLPDPAPAVPGPGVVVVDISNRRMAGSDSLYLVDDAARTIQRLDAPDEVRYWGPNVDEFLWGVTAGCQVFWATAGTFEERQLPCSDGLDFSYGIYADEFPPGWLQPGRMAFVERSDGRQRNQNFVHVSLDGGATWQRIPKKDGATIADVLQPLG